MCATCFELLEPTTAPGAIASAFAYGGPMADALRKLKYGGRRDVARSLAPLLATALAAAGRDCELIIPVPLGQRRLWARGYNQAERLAHYAGALVGLPLDRRSLRRNRSTLPQARLDRVARQANVRGAFVVPAGRRARLRGRSILLFDDVATTGATLTAAAVALGEAGAGRVSLFAAARRDS